MFKLTLALTCTIFLAAAAVTVPLFTKIDPKLAHGLKTKQSVEILIQFKSTQSTLAGISTLNFNTRGQRASAVASSLQTLAQISQASVQEFFKSNEIVFKSFWVNNQIYLKSATEDLINKLVQFDSVISIRENEYIPLEPIKSADTKKDGNSILAEWGVENIQANAVWTLPGGSNGTGVRVCTIDTGALYTHEALRNNYLGNYGWFDPGASTDLPNDQNGHGTHTTGTIAGINGIGVAPGAKWQACKGCASAFCSNADLIACGQWVVCPTLANGTAPNCDLAPHLSSNSWAGGQGQSWYDDVIRSWHAAGVIPIFANGNSGPTCNTANYPADSQAGVIGVGATTSANDLASFSSRGPSLHATVKPDIAAPGQDVRSAYNEGDNSYASLSGTSMACPHVAGVVALLFGINENLAYNRVTQLLYGNADTNVTPPNQNCGGIIDTTYPNNGYGYGKVNALRSAQALIGGKF